MAKFFQYRPAFFSGFHPATVEFETFEQLSRNFALMNFAKQPGFSHYVKSNNGDNDMIIAVHKDYSAWWVVGRVDDPTKIADLPAFNPPKRESKTDAVGTVDYEQAQHEYTPEQITAVTTAAKELIFRHPQVLTLDELSVDFLACKETMVEELHTQLQPWLSRQDAFNTINMLVSDNRAANKLAKDRMALLKGRTNGNKIT